jgi:hypothetical protein
MASRANKENREDVPTYGAPTTPPTPTPEQAEARERRRREKLRKQPTAEERQKEIEEHIEKGKEASKREEERRAEEARKPRKPPRTIGPGEGRPTIDIIGERGRDIDVAVEEEETGEEVKRAPGPENEPVMAPRKKKKRK